MTICVGKGDLQWFIVLFSLQQILGCNTGKYIYKFTASSKIRSSVFPGLLMWPARHFVLEVAQTHEKVSISVIITVSFKTPTNREIDFRVQTMLYLSNLYQILIIIQKDQHRLHSNRSLSLYHYTVHNTITLKGCHKAISYPVLQSSSIQCAETCVFDKTGKWGGYNQYSNM